MNIEKLPIKFFAPRKIDEQRIEAGGNSETPPWVLEGSALKQRADELKKSFNNLTEQLDSRIKRNSAVPFVFIAKMCDDATSKSRRGYISSLLQSTAKNSVIGLCASDELVVKIDSIQHMHEISNGLTNYERNKYAISCLKTFSEFHPDIANEEDNCICKVKLINFQDNETNAHLQKLFEDALAEREIEFKRSDYTSYFCIYKVCVSQNVLLDALRDDDAYNALFSIEPMPEYAVAFDSLDNQDHVDVLTPLPDSNYETLGILDSGIARIPHLTSWISSDRWTVYPESEINPSHGTFVAGVALYGDILEGKEWIGHRGIKLFDAAICPNNIIYEDELIENIKEVIKENHEKIKVWNLSVSVTDPVSDSKFSDLAIALDELQTKYNVLICKSAGNCTNFANGSAKKGRIHAGADSIRSLVVGSVAHEKGQYDLAEIDNPSPFSRIGPGPEYIIKPEVSHYGGNAGVDLNGRISRTGVKSFSKEGALSANIGTSFSTPRIAALATGLYQELDIDFDPLLLKGLIIHSSSYSEKLNVPEMDRTNQLGFGIPKSISEILFNKPYEATLILRNNLAKGEKIDIMDFPMPKSLIREGYYTGQIIVTLVYDPILDPTQGVEYCQSNIDVKFGSYDSKVSRDTSRRNILNPVGRKGAQNLLLTTCYSKKQLKGNQNEFALRERLLIKYQDKYYPVKKYAVDLSELTESNRMKYAKADRLWYLSLSGLFRDHTEQRARQERELPNQNYCLIITIRDPEYKANVYDDVTQGLDAYNFWHSNIKVTSDISVSIFDSEIG